MMARRFPRLLAAVGLVWGLKEIPDRAKYVHRRGNTEEAALPESSPDLVAGGA